MLIDEIFTPDCSRYCKTSISDQEYLDKQYFRDYLKEINWNNEQIKIPDDIKKKNIVEISGSLQTNYKCLNKYS